MARMSSESYLSNHYVFIIIIGFVSTETDQPQRKDKVIPDQDDIEEPEYCEQESLDGQKKTQGKSHPSLVKFKILSKICIDTLEDSEQFLS
jgi:hypothetical protein